jgi:thymidylate synthase ThyX
MGPHVKILKDSIGPSGKRITTYELRYQRFIHSELMTHRLFSRNSASSRAIPIEKMLKQIEEDPAMPVWWGKNQAGMAAEEELSGKELEKVKENWLSARDHVVHVARILKDFGLHKQIANRVTEPWMFITVILTATEYDNFFKLRCNPAAQPEIRWVAEEMKKLYDSNKPQKLDAGDWHLPLIDRGETDGLDDDSVKKISVGRCARVSYLTHDGKRDPNEDIVLASKLMSSGHWSPFEHVAMALETQERVGNFVGWRQYRADVDPDYTPSCEHKQESKPRSKKS